MSQTTQDYFVTVVDVSEPTRKGLLEQASEWAEELGSLRGSIENGEANTAGRYGELVFKQVFGGEIADNYDYDILFNGFKIDVKSKRRTVKAQPRYEASIADWNPDQDCDLYYFTSIRTGAVDEPYRYVDLFGYIDSDTYHEKATFHKAGEKDPDNGFTFSADCYNLPYRELTRRKGMNKQVKI